MPSEALRVVQLDASYLDNELRNILSSNINSLIVKLPPRIAVYIEQFRLELQLLNDFILWSHRLTQGCSPGQKLLNIRYENYSRCTVGFHFVVSIVLPYIRQRLELVLSRLSISEMQIQWWESLNELLQFVYHCYFIRFGGYQCITERLLNLRSVHRWRPRLGTMNYDAVNRELLWIAFRDLLLFLYPLQILIQRVWCRRKRHERINSKHSTTKASNHDRSHHLFGRNNIRTDFGLNQILTQQKTEKEVKKYTGTEENQREYQSKSSSFEHETSKDDRIHRILICSYCEQTAVIPVRNSACGHTYCYYCFWIEPSCSVCGIELIFNAKLEECERRK